MFLNTVKSGVFSGLRTCWFLFKVIIPVYFIVTVVKYTPVMGWLADLFRPVMGLFNMPGEAALAIITGLLLDEYGAIAALSATGVTGYAVTVVLVMIALSHGLPIESAIAKKLGLSVTFFLAYRLIAAAIVGLVFSWAGVLLGLW